MATSCPSPTCDDAMGEGAGGDVTSRSGEGVVDEPAIDIDGTDGGVESRLCRLVQDEIVQES